MVFSFVTEFRPSFEPEWPPVTLGYAIIRSIESVITRAGQRKSRKNSGYGVGEKEVAAVDVALLAEGRGMED